MAGYQLWSPWTPLDENLQWLRRTTPTFASKHPFRVSPFFPQSPSDLEVHQCFHEVAVVLERPRTEAVKSSELSGHPPDPQRGTAARKKRVIKKPQPIRLIGLDSVFGRVITIQPPRWTGTFRVSETSAFSKIVSKDQQWPTGLKEQQIEMTMAMCKQMLRSILLLYAIYKKCTFALQHSQ
ncbi:FANCD2 opposite strand protein-like [Arvicanthis niloticus]|uniref:FANCD2 opposite strand protein-like n=1 Tax=Arvicanthis niloticus TaxID=61156 RepID=UPI001486D8B1|nr:FANCD2 opposite strand protein-like [Arvicanthis niloticus]